MKRFLVVRVSAEPTYAEGLPPCGKRRYPVFKIYARLNAFRSRCFWMRQDFRTCKVRVPEGCSQPEEIRPGAPACGKRRYPVSVVKKAKRILLRACVVEQIKSGILCFSIILRLQTQQRLKILEIYAIIINEQDKCVKMHNSVLSKMQRGYFNGKEKF